MMTFELNTMHWMGLTDLTYRDSRPLLSVNEDYAALLVADSAEWSDLQELEADLRGRAEGEKRPLQASGTASGGAWHLALAGWLDSADLPAEAVTWIPSEGSSPSLQQLLSGGVDMVCCSLPEARSLLESGDVRALGVMSPKRAVGFDSVPTFREQGRDWTLGGWRGLGLPKETPDEIVTTLANAIERIVSRPAEAGSFAEFMQQQRFDDTWRRPPEFEEFLAENDDKLGKLLNSPALATITEDRFSPMTYPTILLGLLALTGIALAVSSRLHLRSPDPSQSPEREVVKENKSSKAAVSSPSQVVPQGYQAFAIVVVAIAAFGLLAETLGFLIISSVILLGMLLYFGSRPLIACVITCLFVPTIYLVFDHLLRVPLPRGWLG
jgi:tripartite-type tricarboxylate transporter receptor subunit TctC